MSDSHVNSQVTDAITQVTVHDIANGPSVGAVGSYVTSSQAQNTVFASAVRRQEQLAIAGMAATVKGAMQILSISKRCTPPAPMALADESEEPVKETILGIEEQMAEDLKKAESTLSTR